MVVDDEKHLTDVFEDFINGNFKTPCSTASNSKEALELMEKKRFHVVITGLDMPLMDGCELIKNIKKNYDSETILLTGSPDIWVKKDDVFKDTEFLPKPVSLSGIEKSIKTVYKQYMLKQQFKAAEHELETIQKQIDKNRNNLLKTTK